MSHYIRNLIAQGEHQRQDFKFEISDSKKIAKSLSAFSNTDGGKLLVGVKDNGSIAGVRSEEEYYMIEAAAQMYCKPEVFFTSKQWKIDGKDILEIDIPKDKDKRPVLAQDAEGKWLPYLRVADQNLVVNQVLLKVWEKQKNSTGVFIKYSKAEKTLLEYLDANGIISLTKYCKIAGIPHRLAQNILVNFIMLDIIDIVITQKQTYYRINENFDLKEIEDKFG
ncbi:MAG: ATP-binding protein [Bacteroidales bacterium]|nr:ATP-binding protein [Bacteroidales bacterium]MCF8456429.1 ATP-binding protein [Bacteroidales bacterium]